MVSEMKTTANNLILQSANVEVVQVDGADGGKPTLYKARLFSEKPNRRGDIVVVAGMDTSEFERNPVVLHEHGYAGTRLPIGRATRIIRHKASIDAEFEFDPDDPTAQLIERKFSNGFLRQVSVGFNIKQAEPVDPDDDSWFAPMRYNLTELVEFSIVAVGADTSAIRKQALTAWRKSQSVGKIRLSDTTWGSPPQLGG